jgi:hypothetical protein
MRFMTHHDAARTWRAAPESAQRADFLFGLDLILDGVQALIDRPARAS